jgi:hypothetical protein
VGSGAASGACARCSGQLRVKGMWWCTPCHMRLSGRELAGMHRRCGHAAAGVRHVVQRTDGGFFYTAMRVTSQCLGVHVAGSGDDMLAQPCRHVAWPEHRGVQWRQRRRSISMEAGTVGNMRRAQHGSGRARSKSCAGGNACGGGGRGRALGSSLA